MMAMRGIATNANEQGQKAASPGKETLQSFPPT